MLEIEKNQRVSDNYEMPMFAVIYRGFVYPEKETEYLKLWKIVAGYFVTQRGALGSTLHKTLEGEYIAYSRWPDQQTRDDSWGNSAKYDEMDPIKEVVHKLKDCIDTSRPFEEICMNVQSTICLDNNY